MDAIKLSRITTAATLGIGGMIVGHVVMPYGADGTIAKRVAFWALVGALGAFRGWRDGDVREVHGRRLQARILVTTLGALALASAGFVAMHGAARLR